MNARVDPSRYARQIRIFHDFFDFDRLGIVYETDTIDGHSYAAVNDVRMVAKERGLVSLAYVTVRIGTPKELILYQTGVSVARCELVRMVSMITHIIVY